MSIYFHSTFQLERFAIKLCLTAWHLAKKRKYRTLILLPKMSVMWSNCNLQSFPTLSPAWWDDDITSRRSWDLWCVIPNGTKFFSEWVMFLFVCVLGLSPGKWGRGTGNCMMINQWVCNQIKWKAAKINVFEVIL